MSLKIMSHRYRQLFFFAFAVCAGTILYSCSEEEEKKKDKQEAVSEMLAIETLFDQDHFEDA